MCGDRMSTTTTTLRLDASMVTLFKLASIPDTFIRTTADVLRGSAWALGSELPSSFFVLTLGMSSLVPFYVGTMNPPSSVLPWRWLAPTGFTGALPPGSGESSLAGLLTLDSLRLALGSSGFLAATESAPSAFGAQYSPACPSSWRSLALTPYGHAVSQSCIATNNTEKLSMHYHDYYYNYDCHNPILEPCNRTMQIASYDVTTDDSALCFDQFFNDKHYPEHPTLVAERGSGLAYPSAKPGTTSGVGFDPQISSLPLLLDSLTSLLLSKPFWPSTSPPSEHVILL